MITQPLKNNWKIDEDAPLKVDEQIKNRADSESNFVWALKPHELTIMERAKLNEELGRKFLSKSVHRWNYKPTPLY